MTIRSTSFRTFTLRMDDDEAIFSIDEGELLEGTFPKNKQKLVQAWMEIHKEYLMTDWRLAVSGQNPLPIKPLE